MIVALSSRVPAPVASRAAVRGRIEGILDAVFDRAADPFDAWCRARDLQPGTWTEFRAAYLAAHRKTSS